jgi:hypothetical protein
MAEKQGSLFFDLCVRCVLCARPFFFSVVATVPLCAICLVCGSYFRLLLRNLS